MNNNDQLSIHRISAFSLNNEGGNPAGVAIGEQHPTVADMQAIAADVGYSETAFLAPVAGSGIDKHWKVRYFSPEIEVPFCGHATIASGRALAESCGEGLYTLSLNHGDITLNIDKAESGEWEITLQSTPVEMASPDAAMVNDAAALFGFSTDKLDNELEPGFGGAGTRHLIFVVKDKATLQQMKYDFEPVKALMLAHDLTTISIVWKESDSVYHARNAFASGGVYEDPATGAAAAALAGYLRNHVKKDGEFTIVQGVDMGSPSRLNVRFSADDKVGVWVSGETRMITE